MDQTPIKDHEQQESSQFEIHPSNMILYQQYSPVPFRMNASPHINNEFYQDDNYFPFELQPLQKMFEQPASPQQSPQIKQLVIKQSNSAQKGFRVVRINTNHMTPQAKRDNDSRKFYSERIEKKTSRNQILEQSAQRSQKGLRNLSCKVRDIVLELRSTTYKDVAERLIQELGQDGSINEIDNVFTRQQLESKEEQNIKRRVYDALNVMIASKVLRKEGKKVLSDGFCAYKNKSKKNERECKLEELNNLKRMVDQKRKRLSELYIKILGLKNLVERNQNNKNENKIMFPILIFTNQLDKIKLTMDNKVLKIKSQCKLTLQADLDILAQMEMYKRNANLINTLPNEMVQYLNNPIKEFCQVKT